MKKDFVEYPESLALKELGFDEPCFGFYYLYKDENHQEGKFDYRGELNIEYSIYKENTYYILAPLYQQVFRWFREKHNLHPYIITIRGEWIVIGIIRCSDAEKITGSFDTNFNTLEEAELECVKKLIEIVKDK